MYDVPPADGDYVSFTETAMVAEQHGVAFLNGMFDYVFTGSVSINLPQVVSDGATINWQAADVSVEAFTDGAGSIISSYLRSGSTVGIYESSGIAQAVAIRIQGHRAF
jgi:hypothetical protein